MQLDDEKVHITIESGDGKKIEFFLELKDNDLDLGVEFSPPGMDNHINTLRHDMAVILGKELGIAKNPEDEEDDCDCEGCRTRRKLQEDGQEDVAKKISQIGFMGKGGTA